MRNSSAVLRMSGFGSGKEPVNNFSDLSLKDEQGHNSNRAKVSFQLSSTDKTGEKKGKGTRLIIPTYEWSKIPRGYCLIININEFSSGDLDRKGSEGESQRLGALFEKLGFQVIFSDKYLTKDKAKESTVEMTVSKILEVLNKVRQDEALKTHEAFILFIMSHGSSGKIKACDGYSVYVDQIFCYFTDHNCPNLKGKPKLIFIEACRGENLNSSKQRKPKSPVKEDTGINCSDGAVCMDKSEALLSTDSAQDMAIVYSTLDGYKALRDEHVGSWFGVAIEDVFTKYAKNHEFNDLVRKVNQKVSKRSRVHRQVLEWHYKGFGKKFYFLPFPTEETTVKSKTGASLKFAAPAK